MYPAYSLHDLHPHTIQTSTDNEIHVHFMRTQKDSRVSVPKYAKHHENSLLMINPSLPKHGMRFKRANTALAPSSASQIQGSAPDTLPKWFPLESVFAVTKLHID